MRHLNILLPLISTDKLISKCKDNIPCRPSSRSRSLYAVARPSVVNARAQAVVILGNISTAFGTLAIR